LWQHSPQRDQRLVEAEDRFGIGIEIDDILVGEIVGQRQPGHAGRKSGVVGRIPLHRRAAAVAADADSGNILFEGVAHLVGRDWHLMHPNLVTVIERRRAAQGE